MDSPDPKITEEAFAQLNAAFAKFHRQTVDDLLNVNTPADHPPATLTKEDFDAACAMLRGIKHTVPVRVEYHVNPDSLMPYVVDTLITPATLVLTCTSTCTCWTLAYVSVMVRHSCCLLTSSICRCNEKRTRLYAVTC